MNDQQRMNWFLLLLYESYNYTVLCNDGLEEKTEVKVNLKQFACMMCMSMGWALVHGPTYRLRERKVHVL